MKKGFSSSARAGHLRPAAPCPVTRPPPRRLLAATAGLFLLIFGLASPANADERPEILNILSQFVASSTAAARCDDIDDDQMVAFLANQQMIYLQSVMALEDQHPEATGEQIAATLLRGQEDIQTQVKQRIDEHGCDDPNAQALIELFAMQAEWRPGHSPRNDTE